mmetsp:Transcript_10053/g.28586  ORF Transcript_10053/g.28586 Transcript_10053/m.28586 type:complete len:235 (+) Transcript_10053:62-766(+)
MSEQQQQQQHHHSQPGPLQHHPRHIHHVHHHQAQQDQQQVVQMGHHQTHHPQQQQQQQQHHRQHRQHHSQQQQVQPHPHVAINANMNVQGGMNLGNQMHVTASPMLLHVPVGHGHSQTNGHSHQEAATTQHYAESASRIPAANMHGQQGGTGDNLTNSDFRGLMYADAGSRNVGGGMSHGGQEVARWPPQIQEDHRQQPEQQAIHMQNHIQTVRPGNEQQQQQQRTVLAASPPC